MTADQMRAWRRQLHLDEDLVRSLLGQWVSELEPAIAYQNGKIIGLTLADTPVGAVAPIVVAA